MDSNQCEAVAPVGKIPDDIGPPKFLSSSHGVKSIFDRKQWPDRNHRNARSARKPNSQNRTIPNPNMPIGHESPVFDRRAIFFYFFLIFIFSKTFFVCKHTIRDAVETSNNKKRKRKKKRSQI